MAVPAVNGHGNKRQRTNRTLYQPRAKESSEAEGCGWLHHLAVVAAVVARVARVVQEEAGSFREVGMLHHLGSLAESLIVLELKPLMMTLV